VRQTMSTLIIHVRVIHRDIADVHLTLPSEVAGRETLAPVGQAARTFSPRGSPDPRNPPTPSAL
jgi:hypothetical protein